MNGGIPATLLEDHGEFDFSDIPDFDRQTYMLILQILDQFVPEEFGEAMSMTHIAMIPAPIMADRKRRFKKALLDKVTLDPKHNDKKSLDKSAN